MKVKIGPYKSWVGPYQIAELLCFWVKPVTDEYGFKSKPEWVHDFGTWLSGGESGESWLLKACQWIESKRTRQAYVRIDKYDTWSMDSTLALVILPMLQQLQATKHGAPCVDDEDVPDELKSTSAPAKESEWDTDENHHKRWDWVLDQMIHAFECKSDDDSWADQYRSGEHEIYFEPSAWDDSGKPTMHRMKHGPNDTYVCDYDAMALHQARITNGFRLFGKYYENLWD
jgi:hypothetical protein